MDDGNGGPKKQNSSCGLDLGDRVGVLVSETQYLRSSPEDGGTEDQAGSIQELTRQLVIYADQMKEMRQSLDWFQENLRQEEDHRQAAEQQSAQLSDLCVGQAMQLEVLRDEREALENRWKELHVDMDSRFEVQHQEGQEVEATAAASDNCTLEDLKPDLKGNEASKSRLLEEQKQVLGDQLKEGERLRCSLESKVHALRRQVEQLELSRQIAEETGEMICYQNRAWRLALRLTIQSCFYFLAVYVWLKNFHSEVAVPLPT